MSTEKKVTYIYSGNSIALNYDGKAIVVTGSDKVGPVLELLKNNDFEKIYEQYFAPPKVYVKQYGDRVEQKDGFVYVDGKPVSGLLNTRLNQYIEKGLPVKPLVAFWRRIQSNPSNQAILRLFECLDYNHHPISEDGRFLAWKRVRSDFKDIHSGTFDNSIGTVVEVPRNQVDENMDRTCSYGLHVASYNYAHHQYAGSQGVLLEVLVDPADVVAIPRDYNNQKMRVCKYEVVRTCEDQRKDVLVNSYGESVDLNDYEDDSTGLEDFYDEVKKPESDIGYNFGEPDEDYDLDLSDIDDVDDDDDYLDDDDYEDEDVDEYGRCNCIDCNIYRNSF